MLIYISIILLNLEWIISLGENNYPSLLLKTKSQS